MVGTATAARHHVVNLEHLERKLHLAAVALPFLLAEQYVPILPVVDRRLNVGALPIVIDRGGLSVGEAAQRVARSVTAPANVAEVSAADWRKRRKQATARAKRAGR